MFKPTKRITAERAAGRIFSVLARAPGKDYEKAELLRRTALRPPQFGNGIRYLKAWSAERLQGEPMAFVITYSGKYRLTGDPDVIAGSRIERMKDAHSRTDSLASYLVQLRAGTTDRAERSQLKAAQTLVATAASLLDGEAE